MFFALCSVYIPAFWKTVTMSNPDIPNMQMFGWNGDGRVAWLHDIYPDDILNMVFEENFEETENNNCIGESDAEVYY